MIAFADAGITTFDCADIYTGVEEHDRRVPPALPHAARRAALRRHQGAHQVRARPRHAAAHHQSLCRGRHRPLAAAAQAWSGSTSCSSIGGTMPCRAISRRPAGWTSCGAPARSTGSARTNFDTGAHAGTGRERRAAGLDAGAVFAARRPAGQAHGRRRRRSTASRCSATARSRAGSSATAGWACPSRQPASRTAR